MKNLFIILFCIAGLSTIHAQKYFTRDGFVHFYSETPMETIEADNNKLNCVLDLATGNIQLAALVKVFHFDRALMEEHFNENYMESSKYPKASFKGQITNIANIDFEETEKQPVQIQGTLTIHGVQNAISTQGSLWIVDGKIHAVTAFDIAPEDYGIKIPGVVRDKIAKNIHIDIKLVLQPFEK